MSTQLRMSSCDTTHELMPLAAIAHRRVADDPVALRELARVIRGAEMGMLRVIDRWAARARRERGAA